ncbi:hypothetical protein DPM33_27965 [Mesorhizobium hawassense]|uniref:Uncharacterized protein n=1 Tax=Mesorhizobium hawassense TaxID=1209954 RepID=A0A330HD91_9HYPH|nr:hypothetical protein DPM33_27965 [Mesorhizobium hawassense]
MTQFLTENRFTLFLELLCAGSAVMPPVFPIFARVFPLMQADVALQVIVLRWQKAARISQGRKQRRHGSSHEAAPWRDGIRRGGNILAPWHGVRSAGDGYGLPDMVCPVSDKSRGRGPVPP